MTLSWEERARRVRGGETNVATAPVAIGGPTHRAMFEAMFRHTADSVVICSATGEYLEVSEPFCELTGYSRAELLGQTPVTLGMLEPGGVRVRVEMDAMIRRHGLYEQRLIRKDGALRWVEFSHQAIGPRRTLVIIRDITAAKETEEPLRERASVDALTHVLNGGSFREQAEAALAQWPEALLVVADVDGLKVINDTWGRAVGDEAIAAVASALVSSAGPGALVGRLGGDEFAALLTGATEDPEFTVRRVRIALLHIRLKSVEEHVSASLGVAGGRLGYGALEHAADAAMYAGKRYRPDRRRDGR